MSKESLGIERAALPIPQHRPPFLVWPVARREFYAAIAVALALPLAWGIVIFGWRALLVLIGTVAAASLVHMLLRRFSRRGRKRLLWAHTLVSALLLVALCQPLWPPAATVLAGAVLVLLIWLFGGAGHERVHVALLLALALSWFYAAPRWRYTPGSSAILARNRLFMGDLTQSAPKRLHAWPRSAEIDGDDAVRLPLPNAVVSGLLNRLKVLAAHTPSSPDGFPPAARVPFKNAVYDAVFDDLPSMDHLLLGAAPGAIGVVSCLGIALAGLYLAYRNILRPRSCSLFLVAALAGLVFSTFSADLANPALATFPRLWRLTGLSEMVALLCYWFFSSDILLAAVFILALPGSEPLTQRGRRYYLLVAGLTAGLLLPLGWPVPTATLTLAGLELAAPLFDKVFRHRSWLHGTR